MSLLNPMTGLRVWSDSIAGQRILELRKRICKFILEWSEEELRERFVHIGVKWKEEYTLIDAQLVYYIELRDAAYKERDMEYEGSGDDLKVINTGIVTNTETLEDKLDSLKI